MIAVWLRESALGSWVFAFTLTQAVEIPIWMRAHKKPLRVVKALGASAITHPLLWWIFMPMWHGSYWSSIVVGEALVIAIEAAYARALGVKRPLAWSFVANVASTAVGFAVYYALGWI